MDSVVIGYGDRDIPIPAYEGDRLWFTYSCMGESVGTKSILLEELFEILKRDDSWRENLCKNLITDTVGKWKNKCNDLNKENEKLQTECGHLRGELASLKRTIKIVGKD